MSRCCCCCCFRCCWHVENFSYLVLLFFFGIMYYIHTQFISLKAEPFLPFVRIAAYWAALPPCAKRRQVSSRIAMQFTVLAVVFVVALVTSLFVCPVVLSFSAHVHTFLYTYIHTYIQMHVVM